MRVWRYSGKRSEDPLLQEQSQGPSTEVDYSDRRILEANGARTPEVNAAVDVDCAAAGFVVDVAFAPVEYSQ